jgi:hypothetical protein
MTESVQLNAQLQQLEINATNCVRDLATLVATLDAALREVNGIASEHMNQLSASSDQLATGVESAVSAADALGGAVRDAARQVGAVRFVGAHDERNPPTGDAAGPAGRPHRPRGEHL